jgi:hypothetical protein
MKTVNYEIVQGDTFILTVVYKDDTGTVIDLTGYSATFIVKDVPGGEITCTTATIGNGIVATPLQGKLVVTLSATETKKFTVPKAYYQFQIDSGTEKPL